MLERSFWDGGKQREVAVFSSGLHLGFISFLHKELFLLSFCAVTYLFSGTYTQREEKMLLDSLLTPKILTILDTGLRFSLLSFPLCVCVWLWLFSSQLRFRIHYIFRYFNFSTWTNFLFGFSGIPYPGSH